MQVTVMLTVAGWKWRVSGAAPSVGWPSCLFMLHVEACWKCGCLSRGLEWQPLMYLNSPGRLPWSLLLSPLPSSLSSLLSSSPVTAIIIDSHYSLSQNMGPFQLFPFLVVLFYSSAVHANFFYPVSLISFFVCYWRNIWFFGSFYRLFRLT